MFLPFAEASSNVPHELQSMQRVNTSLNRQRTHPSSDSLFISSPQNYVLKSYEGQLPKVAMSMSLRIKSHVFRVAQVAGCSVRCQDTRSCLPSSVDLTIEHHTRAEKRE